MSEVELTIQQLIDAKAIIAVQDGNHGGQHPKSSEYTPTGIPFVMASDLTEDGRVNLGKVTRLPKERCEGLRIGFAVDGDVLLTHKGTVGLTAIVNGAQPYWMLTPQVTYYRTNPELLSNKYLLYCFRSADFQSQLANISAQSTRPYVSISTQRSLRVRWCDIDLQRRIASILSAYDDLIEVNQRRIAILEDMARRLFDEWFVRFRFPGHEAVPLVETELGMVPEGWNPGSFRECVDVNPETLSPRRAPDQINYIDISSVSVGCVDAVVAIKFSEAPGRARRVIRDGDVIWSTVRPNRRSHALLLGVAPNTVASTGFAALRTRNLDWAWVYEATRTDAFVGFLVGRARGSAYPAVVGADFEDVPLVVPPLSLRLLFQRQAGPKHQLASTLHRQNSKLRAARDLLLPKLLSGEIDVSAAEHTFAEAAE